MNEITNRVVFCNNKSNLLFIEICGGYVIPPQGVLYSPGYPGLYFAKQKCIWRITAPENHHVELNFTTFEVSILLSKFARKNFLYLILISVVRNMLTVKFEHNVLGGPNIKKIAIKT